MNAHSYDWIGDDAELLSLIADAVVDPPATSVSAARALYTWRTIDSELAALLAPAPLGVGDPTGKPDPQPGGSAPTT
jgi:hypothetical protein